MEFAADLPVQGFSEFERSLCFCRVNSKKKRDGWEISGTNKLTIHLHTTEGEDSAESALARMRKALASQRVFIDGRTPEKLWLANATVSFDDDGEFRFGEFEVCAQLPHTIPIPFTPGLVSPSQPGDASFDDAFIAAHDTARLACLAAEIIETDRYWLFPVRAVGCLGSIVDRRTGKATVMGSGTKRTTWIWAWEQGLANEGAPFVVESCSDPTLLRARLKRVYRLEPDAFQQLPMTLPYDWRAFEAFHDSREFCRVRAETSVRTP